MAYKVGEVIYIKFLRFADSNEIDYRVNGRPYLIYEIKDDKLYLLKIGSRALKPEYCFYKVNVIVKGRKKQRESFVDMRNIIVVDANKIELAMDSMFYDKNPHKRKAKHNSKISEEEFREVNNNIKILMKINKTRISSNNSYMKNKKEKKW